MALVKGFFQGTIGELELVAFRKPRPFLSKNRFAKRRFLSQGNPTHKMLFNRTTLGEGGKNAGLSAGAAPFRGGFHSFDPL